MSVSALDDRKIAILRAVIEHYVSTGQPVGSGHVAKLPGLSVSPATIRNDMAHLEQEGFLAQPHTSAGRVPTDKGYRFYVDHLTSRDVGLLDAASRERVGTFFDSASFRLEETLHRTSLLLSQLTNYTAVVTGPTVVGAEVRSVQVVGLSERHGTVVAVMSNGIIESQHVEFPAPMTDDQLIAVTRRLSEAMVGKAIADVAFERRSGDGVDADVEALAAAIAAALPRHESDESVFVGGASALTHAFDAVDVVRQVLETLEQQYVVVSLVRDLINRGLSVAIGTEHGVEPLSACSVVIAPVVRDGTRVGSVGVLGPTRMNYPQALATVEVVGDQLGRRLSEG